VFKPDRVAGPPAHCTLLWRPLAALALSLGVASAYAEPMSFEAAQLRLADKSGTLRAARLNREARELEAEATRSLSLPQVNATVAYSKLERDYEIDVAPITGALNQAVGAIGGATGVKLPALPATLDYKYKNEGVRPIVGFNWPLFTGGKISATQDLAAARTAEAGAEVRHTEEALTTQLVKYYYGLQLAEHAVAVRSAVLDALTQHLHQAERFEKTGLIARADRLHAQVAYDEAQRNLFKAQDDRTLAQIALNRMLAATQDVVPASPLFVRSAPVEPIERWTQHGLAAHPGLALLDAKRQQTAQLETIARAALMPEVFAFGTYQFNKEVLTPVEPDWIVGVGVRFTLFDRLDRSSLIAASQRQSAGVTAYTEQARDDISTLIEKRWRELEQARQRYLLLESSIALAKENVQLRERGFGEGLSTSLDLVDARLSLSRAEIDRAQAARDYVVALAELLEASGQSERFNEYAAHADIRIERPTPAAGRQP